MATKHGKPAAPREHRGGLGSEYAAFISPTYRSTFTFLFLVTVGLVAVSSAATWIVHGAGTFIDDRVHTTWSEAALRAKTEHLQYESQIKDHGGRIERLEQQNQETRGTLAEIRSTVMATAEAVRDLRDESKRQAAAMQAADVAAATYRGRSR